MRTGVPTLLELERLLQATERVLRDEDTSEDLRLILAPGSSLDGARPKASVIDRHGHLTIAKFPKEADEYSLETREEIALRLAGQAGIAVPVHVLVQVSGRAVLISRRFDREDGVRIPFLSALSLTGQADGERGSYPELVDSLAMHGAQTCADAAGLLIGEVGRVTARWREVAGQVGAARGEIARMSSAFEHEDSRRAVML